jgi:hypothetical protein
MKIPMRWIYSAEKRRGYRIHKEDKEGNTLCGIKKSFFRQSHWWRDVDCKKCLKKKKGLKPLPPTEHK